MRNLILFISIVLFSSCGNNKPDKTITNKLPIYGERYYDDELKDTVFHVIPDFSLTNQNNQEISNKNIKGKIVVADFFFTSCTTICPKMTSQLKRVAKQIEKFNDVIILSHTVDPETDNVSTLKNYADINGIDTKKWWFLTGDEDFIHEHGGQGYLLNVMRDSTAQGGFLHSEKFILLDKKSRIRGIYDGTDTKQVDQLISDITLLKKEDDGH